MTITKFMTLVPMSAFGAPVKKIPVVEIKPGEYRGSKSSLKKSLKKQANMSRDLSQYDKTVAKFFNDNIRKIWDLADDKAGLIDFLQQGLKKSHVSDKYMKKMVFNINKQRNADAIMKYTTNILLKGKGLGL